MNPTSASDDTIKQQAAAAAVAVALNLRSQQAAAAAVAVATLLRTHKADAAVAAAAAVALALSGQQPLTFTQPVIPPATVSAWQLVMRSNQLKMKSRGNLR